MPDDAVLTYVWLFPFRGNRAVLPWKDGKLSLPEGEVRPDETVEAAIARNLEEQVGVLQPTATYLGHFRCKATITAPDQEPGTITYRAIYGVEAGELADFPSAPGYERRLVIQRDLVAVVRDQYFEIRRELMDSLDNYILERAKKALA